MSLELRRRGTRLSETNHVRCEFGEVKGPEGWCVPSKTVSTKNLDRFDLGPSFVDTSSSQGGTRTTSRGAASAKSAAGTGPKVKAIVNSDAVSPAPYQQKTIVVPAQKEFLGKPLIEPK